MRGRLRLVAAHAGTPVATNGLSTSAYRTDGWGWASLSVASLVRNIY
jgi:hypothetical protein